MRSIMLHTILCLQPVGLAKWEVESASAEVVEFMSYFRGEWIDENPNWFEGYAHPSTAPSTNNGNEAINAVIKKEDTFRELLMESGNFSSFNQFVSTALGYWRVTMPDLVDESNWFLATCTCPLYSKNYICKHVVAVALLLKFATKCMPMTAKTIQLGQKRSRGRPGFALPALLRQPSIYACSSFIIYYIVYVCSVTHLNSILYNNNNINNNK